MEPAADDDYMDDIDITAGASTTALKQKKEQDMIDHALFSDIPPTERSRRGTEEKHILLGPKHVVEIKNTFPHPERTFSQEVGNNYAIALEYASIDDAQQEREQECAQLVALFKEHIALCKSRLDLKDVGRSVNTFMRCDENMREALIPLLEVLKEKNAALPPDTEETRRVTYNDSVARKEEDLPTYKLSIIKMPNHKKRPTDPVADVSILTCPTPWKTAKKGTMLKRCTWKRYPLYLSKATVGLPIATACNRLDGERIIVARGRDIQVYKIAGWSLEHHFSAPVECGDHVVAASWVGKYACVAYEHHVIIFDPEGELDNILVAVEHPTRKDQRSISAADIDFDSTLCIGTPYGEACIISLGTQRMQYHSLPRNTYVHQICIRGASVYALNVTDVIQVTQADVNSFACGVPKLSPGSVYCGDRVMGMDACGSLLFTYNKYGALQAQPTRYLPDPEDPQYLIKPYTHMLKMAKSTCKRISYKAVYAGRTHMFRLADDGSIAAIWCK